MFGIQGNNIYISRGEPAVFTITPYEDSGEPHVMDVKEFMRLTVYRRCCPDYVVIEKESPRGYPTFTLDSGDTGRLWPGKYDFKVELIFADGSEKVIIGQTPNFTPHFYILDA